MNRKPKSAGFTLVELLVVIAIIGILVAMLLPAIQSARAASRRLQCKNNVRQTTLAALNYASDFGRLPSLWSGVGEKPWDHFAWRTQLLPFMEYGPVHDQIDFGSSPMDPVNRDVISQLILEFQCPATPGYSRFLDTLGSGPTVFNGLNAATHDYVAVHDVTEITRTSARRGLWNGGPELEFIDGGGFGGDRFSAELRRMTPLLAAVRDGLSNTIMLIEQAAKPDGFGPNLQNIDAAPTEGAWATGDYSSFFGEGINVANYTDPYAFHGAVTASFGDGSVVSISDEISPDVLIALLSRDGNEIVDRSDWE